MIDVSTALERMPHGPGMRLIDRVLYRDADTIECETDRHRVHWPLPRETTALIELGAQAAALHVLLDPDRASGALRGVVAGVREMSVGPARFETLDEETLQIAATFRTSAPGGVSYDIAVRSEQAELVRGGILISLEFA